MTVETVLGIIQLTLQLLVVAAEKLTPEQFQALWDRHEKRLDFYQGLLEKLSAPLLKKGSAEADT